MKKRDWNRKYWDFPAAKLPQIQAAVEKFEARIGGKRGAEEARERFYNSLYRIFDYPLEYEYRTAAQRYADWKETGALFLAEKAGAHHDEHGWRSGDYRSTIGLDYVPPWLAKDAPFCDLGGEGLALVSVERTRRYAAYSKWSPSTVKTHFLVGRNEIGTYFSHPIPASCMSVKAAVQWVWNGMADRIIQRQGDIALVRSAGPKMPQMLPRGHQIEGNYIVHETHPTLPLPGKGERIIVGRRAAERALAATRD